MGSCAIVDHLISGVTQLQHGLKSRAVQIGTVFSVPAWAVLANPHYPSQARRKVSLVKAFTPLHSQPPTLEFLQRHLLITSQRMVQTCPSDNAQAVDQSSFWSGTGLHWDAHRIGWAIAGGCAVLTFILTSISVFLHCRNYTNRAEQRQVIRILYLPTVFAVISFFSYRFFRSYTYYSLIPVAYEAITIGAFLMLLIEYVAATALGHDARNAIQRKDKSPLPFPLCFWRYRPTKAYFMYTIKWAVLQYVIVRPLVSIAGIICQRFGVLCQSAGFNFHFAEVYLAIIDFISISVALYGLIIFYGLTKDELKGRRPLAKFLCIKLIVMVTFYQSFLFHLLQRRVIKPTKYWTRTNIADGLNALAICIEMIFFAAAMWWAYTPNEYKKEGAPKTSIWRPLWDSINLSDFAIEIYGSLKFFFTRKSKTKVRAYDADEKGERHHMDFGEAFGVDGTHHTKDSLETGGARLSKPSYEALPMISSHPGVVSAAQ